MAGFLLEDDAIAARQTAWDAWMDERKQQAEAAKQAAAQAAAPVVQAVQQVAQPVAQAAQTTGDYLGTLNAEQQARAQKFDQWLQSRTPPEPAQVTQSTPSTAPVAGQPTGVGLPSLPHAEEPATSTDTLAAPDLGGRWKTQFDFGSTYTGAYRTGTPHRGVDMVPIKGGIGTEVSAFHPGTVTNISRDNGAGGLMVYVQDDQGLTHAYMHLANTQPGLKAGDRVARGTPLAQMGESGTEGSPHLHYEVRKNAATGDPLDQLIDPRPYVAGQRQAQGGAAAQPGASATAQTTAGLSGGGPLAGQIGQAGQDILSGAANAASWLGEQGQKALQAVLVTEGGLSGARGDNNKSAGPLQFFGEEGGRGGQLNAFANALGMTLEQARQYAIEHPLEAITWAIGVPSNPGYLGKAILDGLSKNLTGADLAEHIQRIGQVSVTPERAGTVWQSLFGQGQPVQQAVGSAVGAARAGAEGALSGAVEASGRARDTATSLLSSTQQTGEALRQEAEAARTRYEQWQAQNQARASEFSANTQRMLGEANQPLFGGQNPLLDQAGQMAQNLAQSPGGQAALNAPLPPLGGQSLGQMGEALSGENLARAGQMVAGGTQAANVEAERQLNEPPVLGAARLGAGLVGQTLSPEIEAGLRTGSRAVPAMQLLDPGGVVSAGLKGGGMNATVNLPILGEVPLADILGLAANFIVPTGAESQFGKGALRTAASAAERAGRPSLQMPAARAIEQGLGAAGRGAMGQAQAFTMAMSGAGRWARASVEEIANDLSRSPIADFMRNEAGILDVDALMQTAQTIKREVVRVYQGTAGDFGPTERADLSRANPDSLVGPAFYTTEDPRIAGGRVTEPESGWAARYGKAEIGFDYGRIHPTQEAARADAAQQRADMLAQYSGLKPSDVPMPIIVPRSKAGGMVEAEGYAQAAGERAGLPAQSTFESYERNIAAGEAELARLRARSETEGMGARAYPEYAPGAGTRITIADAIKAQEEMLERPRENLARALAETRGINVRALDVPKDLRLFDMEHEFTAPELKQLGDFAAQRFGGMSRTEEVFNINPRPDLNIPVAPPTGQDLYDELQRTAGLSKTQINNFLELAGYDGITHEGGNIRPMVDEAGQRIQHRVRALFQSGLDKSRNAYSGGLASAVPGGAAGAASDEDLSPQERLYRGLGGAFVAGALRGKNPALAAFEAQALRKGATAMDIAAAVQAARQEAGKAYKFAGPIADAANKAFNAVPAREAVLSARQFLREFGGKLSQAAPPNAQNDSGMARLHNHLLELARQGESQRFWYTNASEAIKEAAQGDKVKAEKLAQLFAIYSPGATVSANTQMALAAWHQFLEGAPIAVGKTDLDKKASALLYDNKPWAGRKTNNFYRNLMKRIDEKVWTDMGRADGQTGTTVDIWMMRALKYLQDAPSMGPGGQYEFSQRAIERVAKELGWQPDEAQAAIWSSVKAAGEGTGLTEAGYHYGTGLAERATQVGGPNLPDIFKDEAGQDLLAKAAGLFGREGQIPSPAEKASRTLYDAEGNPIYNPKKLAKGVKEALSETIPEAKGALSAQAQRTIDAYAATRAWVQKLPEISWSRVFVEPKPTQRDANSLAVFLGRTITPDEEAQLASRIGGLVDIVPTEDGAAIINMAGRHERKAGDPLAGQWIGESNPDFHKRANQALAELDTVEEASTSPFRAHTNTLTNDWEANPNGESYAAVIGRSARAEALWDVARPLAARAGEAATNATAEPLAGAAGRTAAELGPDAAGAVPGAANAAPGGTNLGGFAMGGTAGAASDEDLTPEERLQRGLGGAFAAGALRRTGAAGAVGRLLPDVQRMLRATTPTQASARTVATAQGPKTAGQHTAEWISSNLLSGPGLIWNVINQTGHLGWQPLQRLVEGHPIEALNGLQSIAASAPEALRRGAAVLGEGLPYAGVGGVQSRPLDKVSVGLRANLAGDAVLRTLNENMAGLLEAQRLIREAGAKTPADAALVINKNAAQLQAYAEKHGNISALTGGTARSPWIQSLSQTKTDLLGSPEFGKQLGGLAMHILMPFARVPEEVLYQTTRNAPLIGQVIDAFQIVKAAPGAPRREATAKAAMNAAIGAAVMGAAVANEIRSADDPEHPNQAHVGNSWVPLTSLGTLGGRMAIAAAVADGLRNPKKPGVEQQISTAVNNLGKVAVQEYPLFDTIRTLGRIGQGGLTSVASGLGSQVLSGLTPLSGTLGAAENITDPYQRDAATSGWADVYEPNLARIPGLANQLPTKVNQATGQPLLKPSSGLGSLLRVQNEPKTQGIIAQEVARLERLGYQIPNPQDNPETVSYAGSSIPLDRTEGQRVAQARGQLIAQQLDQYINSPYWAQLTDDQKAQIIARIMGGANERNVGTLSGMISPEDLQGRVLAGRRVVGRPEPIGVGR